MTDPLKLEIEDVRAPAGTRLKVLRHRFALIGRHPRAEVVLDDPRVSRRHAYLQMIAGRVFYIDLGSRTGIRREGKARPSGWWDLGGTIEIGPYRIRLVAGGRDASGDPAGRVGPPNPLAPWPQDREPAPSVALEVVKGQARPHQRRMDRSLLLVGKSPRCALHLPDRSLSRYHCSLVHTPRGAWIVDLLSREGVRVNGRRVTAARLADGDAIMVGQFLIRLRHDPPEIAGPSPEPVLRAVPMLRDPSAWGMTVCTGIDLPTRSGSSSAQGGIPVVVERSPQWAEHLEPSIALRVHQLGLLQQQMFEQCFQSLMMMFQKFEAMHQDRVKLVQEEIDQIRRLAQELAAIQRDSARRHAIAPPSTPPVAPGGPTEVPAVAGAMRLVGASPFPPHPAPPVVAPSEVAPPELGPTRDRSSAAPHGDRPGHVRHESQPSPEGPLAASNADPTPSPASGAQPAVGGMAEPLDLSMHTHMYRRIMEIQHERQTRWQKILNVVMGR